MVNREYRASRVDKNQSSLVAAFREFGCQVQDTHEIGKGCFDLIVAIDFLNIFIEVKDGRKPPSARRLTPDQKMWNNTWTGLRAVVTNYDEVIDLVKETRELVQFLRGQAARYNVDIQVVGCLEQQYEPVRNYL